MEEVTFALALKVKENVAKQRGTPSASTYRTDQVPAQPCTHSHAEYQS